jgi:hypothetical protein
MVLKGADPAGYFVPELDVRFMGHFMAMIGFTDRV